MQQIKKWFYEYFKRQYRRRGLAYFMARTVLVDHYYPNLCIHWLRNALFGKPVIHAIGDSHTKILEFVPGVSVHHIGQATAHNLYKENNSSHSRELLFHTVSGMCPSKDILLLVFGEIDARVHIYNQHIKTGRPIQSLILDTVSNYGKVIKELHGKGFKVVILGIPPAGVHVYKPFTDGTYTPHNYGSLQERIGISLLFNDLLKEFCELNGILFIDVLSISKDKDGSMRKDYAADEAHLNTKIVPFIMEQLKPLL